MRVVPRRTVVGDTDLRFDNLSGSHHQSHVTIISVRPPPKLTFEQTFEVIDTGEVVVDVSLQ